MAKDVKTVVNLAQNYASAFSAPITARQVVELGGPPEQVIVEVSPELVSPTYSYLPDNVRQSAQIRDIVPCLSELGVWRGGGMLDACFRPLLTGVDSLSRYLGGVHDSDPHSQWMMTHHNGGQFCYDTPACRRSNQQSVQKLGGQWDRRSRTVVPYITERYFTEYTLGVGLNHRYLLELFELAEREGFEVILLNLPVHQTYQAQIPTEDYQRFLSYVTELAEQHPQVRFLDGNRPRIQKERRFFVDPDHLHPEGSRRLMTWLCNRLRST